MRPGPSPFLLLRARRGLTRQVTPHIDHLRNAIRPRSDRFGPSNIPPLSQRLRPLVPFLIWWSIITSLAVHLLTIRHRSREELDISRAKLTVLESLVARTKGGEMMSDEELRRELEMVGLRERVLTRAEEGHMMEAGDVGWGQALFGRRRFGRERKEGEGESGVGTEEEERRAVAEWAEVIKEATATEKPLPPQVITTSPTRTGIARRAPSAQIYM